MNVRAHFPHPWSRRHHDGEPNGAWAARAIVRSLVHGATELRSAIASVARRFRRERPAAFSHYLITGQPGHPHDRSTRSELMSGLRLVGFIFLLLLLVAGFAYVLVTLFVPDLFHAV
jgi:hypothetical protein